MMNEGHGPPRRCGTLLEVGCIRPCIYAYRYMELHVSDSMVTIGTCVTIFIGKGCQRINHCLYCTVASLLRGIIHNSAYRISGNFRRFLSISPMLVVGEVLFFFW